MDLVRTIVIGNSGAGKSWLAARIAQRMQAPWIDLDGLNFEPGGYDLSRPREVVLALAQQQAAQPRWVIEGIYGWIVREIVGHATALIWLCVDEDECVANIHQRGMRGGASEQSFADLIAWAESYRGRDGSSAFLAHQQIFEAFTGDKYRIRQRSDAVDLLGTID
ncbi:adenylate kinase [Cupriavidus sp. RAF12]|uniref:adenylate kinase n=1 Tax=Cupriavidus sp. RAF12 TaxID=3233050 RepID=UPI003F8DE5D3